MYGLINHNLLDSLLEIREEEHAKAPPLFIMAAYWDPLVHPAYGGFS